MESDSRLYHFYLYFRKQRTVCGPGKKIVYALFETDAANAIISDVRFTHRTFSGFMVGKVIDSIIIGIICFFGISMMDIPYAILISVIVGITNIIPFFGPYLGAIPSALLILMVNPLQCLYFIIFILVLQQFDGNVLGPKILGNSTGLSSFWVIFSITLFGGLFGILGMIAGVPIFAVIYAGIKAFINQMLLQKKLPTDTSEYLDVGSIEKGESFPMRPKMQQHFQDLIPIPAINRKKARALSTSSSVPTRKRPILMINKTILNNISK